MPLVVVVVLLGLGLRLRPGWEGRGRRGFWGGDASCDVMWKRYGRGEMDVDAGADADGGMEGRSERWLG